MAACDCSGRFFGPGAWHHARCKAQFNVVGVPHKKNQPSIKLSHGEELAAGNIQPQAIKQYDDDRPNVSGPSVSEGGNNDRHDDICS